ncbi:MAG: nitroreductase family protein [Candidatus Caldatribacteriota bacterium]|nr:nitroreductase family protein [Candidatus Caldatribacteriota bacterium]
MVLEAIKKRQSVRSYQDKEIPEDVLQQILEAGRLAPSAKNGQPWKFIVVKDKKLREKLVPACKNQNFVGEASVVIVGCATNPNYKMGNGEYSYTIDLAIALDHMSLEAASSGLGTCWIGAFYQDKVKEVLEIPEDISVVTLMTLGFPQALDTKKGRKDLSEIVCYDKYTL